MKQASRAVAITLVLFVACGDEGSGEDDSGNRDVGSYPLFDAGVGRDVPIADGMMPPPDTGMTMPPRDGGMMMGPPPCTQQSDCDNACSSAQLGCTCRNTPMGMHCIPNCQQDSDCPQPPQVMGPLVCDEGMGICVPA